MLLRKITLSDLVIRKMNELVFFKKEKELDKIDETILNALKFMFQWGLSFI